MGVIQSFERRLQGAVGNTFARVFGGSVHPAEVMTALQAEAASHLQEQSGRRIAPNSYRVALGQTDRAGLDTDDAHLRTALTDSVREYLAEQGWETFGDVAVQIVPSESMHTGQFSVTSVIDPDIVARVGRLVVPDDQPSQAAPAPVRPDMRQAQPGVGTMTQDPNRPYYPPQQGQPYYPPQEPYPGQEQHYPQQPQQPYHPPYHPPQQPAYDPNQYPPQQPGYQPAYPQQPAYEPTQYPQQPAYDPNQYQQPVYEEYPQQQYAPPAELVATIRLDDGSGRTHQLVRGSNIIGRGQDAHFRLPDTSVSRRHIDIYFDGQVAVMHDLGSTNGSAVNGAGVQTWQLADGDVIRIGHSSLTFSLRG